MTDCVIDLYSGDQLGPSAFHDFKAAGVLGIVHKATEGATLTDKAYASRRRRAASVGILWGAYCFAREGDGKDQALHFLDTAEPDDKTLLSLDWEQPPHGRAALSLAQAESFVSTVRAQAGRWPVLYANYSWLMDAGVAHGSVLAQCPLWVARYNAVLGPLPLPWTDWALWQWTEHGSVPGSGGDTDKDRYNGSVDQLLAKWPF